MSDVNLEIEKLQNEIKNLKLELAAKEQRVFQLKYGKLLEGDNKYNPKLNAAEIVRYSRQMLTSQLGMTGQVELKNASVLIVGAGGLGCPCSLYLAGAGVGHITIVDSDTVELSNLHRQILYREADIDVPKANSASKHLKSINSTISITPVCMHVNSSTVSKLFDENTFHVVIDGSDNVATRYLLNDICVFKRVPLVSGSALQLEGQLTVYNYNGGPCYRCLFPKPPPPESVTSCGDGGVLGPVPGTIGVLQALEAIKILTGQEGVLTSRLLTFDGSDTTFRNIKLRPRNIKCDVCGDEPVITGLIDYEQFCGAKADDKVHNISILKEDDHIKPDKLSLTHNLLIDVRPEIEFEMCHIQKSINFPYKDIAKSENLEKLRALVTGSNAENVYFMCRRGNDSQRAMIVIKDKLNDLPVKFLNVRGGLHLYSKLVDECFPVY